MNSTARLPIRIVARMVFYIAPLDRVKIYLAFSDRQNLLGKG